MIPTASEVVAYPEVQYFLAKYPGAVSGAQSLRVELSLILGNIVDEFTVGDKEERSLYFDEIVLLIAQRGIAQCN